MKKILCIWAFIFLGLSLSAQPIKGKVVDEYGCPLEFVNVVLRNLPDSVYVKGAITDENGCFSLPISGDCVSLSFVGYKSITINSSELSSPIVMYSETTTLNEVVVKGKLPVSKLTFEGLKTQVKGSVLSKAGTANDVLRQLPLVNVEKGNVSVFGKGNPLIYINGRKLRDLSELNQIKSDDIKNVEVITNPGAHYDSSVGSVIRITTILPEGEGVGLSLRSDYFQAEKVDLLEQLHMNYRNNSLDIYGMFQYDHNNYWQKSKLNQNVFVDTLWNQENVMNVEGLIRNYQVQLGFDYRIDEKHILGSRYRNVFSPKKHERSFVNSLVTADGEYFDKWYNEENKLLKLLPTFDWNIYYVGKIGRMTADFNMEFLWSGQNSFSIVNEKSIEQDDRLVESENKVRNKLSASKLVLGYPICSGTLNLGFEHSCIFRKDDYINHQKILPSSFTNLEEKNLSAFVEYNRSFKCGTFKAGLRYEYVAFDYYENDELKPEQSKVYNQFFPNFSFGTAIHDWTMNLSFSSKVNRPTFSQLSNNVFYGNRYTLQAGNPYLKPSINTDLNLMSSWKFFQLMLNYKCENDVIIYWGEQLEDKSAITKVMFRNFDRLRTLSFYFTIGPSFGVYTPRLNIGMRKQWMTLESNNEYIKMDNPLWNISFIQSLKLPCNFLFSLNFSFQTKGDYQNIYFNTTQYIMDISLKKTFMDDKLSVQLKGYDLLNGYRDGNLLYNRQMNIDMLNRYDNRKVGFVVQYTFNMKKKKYNRADAGSVGKSRL